MLETILAYISNYVTTLIIHKIAIALGIGFGIWLLVSLILVNFTWVYFAAVMRLQEVRDAGKLSWRTNPCLCLFSYVNLCIGLVLDTATNIWVASVVMWEIPRECLTTTRLIRWNKSTDTSWYTRFVRKPFVAFGKVMLDPVDTDGVHIK